MRRVTAVLAATLALVLVAATPVMIRFRWMTDKQAERPHKTRLEWACLEGRIDAEPVDIPGKPFEIVSLRAKPTDKGLIVQADLACTTRRLRAPREWPAYRQWASRIRTDTDAIVQTRFGITQYQRFLFITYHGQLWMTLSDGHSAILPLNAPASIRTKVRAACLANENIGAMLNNLYE